MPDIEKSSSVVTFMLQLLSSALNESETALSVDPSFWAEIKKELDAHAVLPLVSDIMMNADISDEEKTELEKATVTNVRTFHKLMTAQTAVINLLNSNDIPAAILKGASAAQYYTRPELRQYGDIDILVSPDDYRRAFDLLCSSGYKNQQDFDANYDRHIGFVTPEGKKVELHRYFSSSSNKEQNALLDGWLFDKLKNPTNIRLGKYVVPVFPAAENGLIILGHINQHLSSGLGLRQIIDWMFFVRAELTDDFWKNCFQAKAEAIGMDYLAKTVTKMCRKYLGLSSEFTWCEDADDDLVDDLMSYIVKKGNFGTKADRDSRSTTMIAHNFANPALLFRYLTKAGSVHMAEAGLKPAKAYAWIYQIGHLLRKTFRRKNKGIISKDIQSGIQEMDLLKRLKVTRF